MLLPNVWAKAASPTAQGVSVHSMHQSLKLDRKPWETAGMPSRRSKVVWTMSDSGRSPRPGNTKLPPSTLRSCAWDRMANALSDRGTRWSRRAFMRAAGTVQVLDFQSTSGQVARRASPGLAALRTRNSKASLVDTPAVD